MLPDNRLAVDGAMVGPKIDGDSLLVCLTWNLRSASRPARDAMLAVINAESARSVVVHVRDPFDQELLGDTVTAYTTNGFRNCQLKAVVNELIQPSA